MGFAHEESERTDDSSRWGIRWPGSGVRQWGIKAPADLRGLYKTQRAHRCSLRTADLRQANLCAAELRAEWMARFAVERAAISSIPVESVNPELPKQPADRIHVALLAGDEMLLDDPATRQGVAAALQRVIHEPLARSLTNQRGIRATRGPCRARRRARWRFGRYSAGPG